MANAKCLKCTALFELKIAKTSNAKLQCPKCGNIGETIVKEECNFIVLITLLFPLIFVLLLLFDWQQNREIIFTEVVHRCPSCNHNCTDVEEIKKEKGSICIII